MRKSEVAVQSEHVLKFVYDKEAQFIRGIVQASMRDRSYQVTVSSSNVNMFFSSPFKIFLDVTAHMTLNVLYDYHLSVFTHYKHDKYQLLLTISTRIS